MSLEPYPSMIPVRQRLTSAPIPDIPAAVHAELARVGLRGRVRPGQRIAITAGSRGIANIAQILQAAVEAVRGAGAEPFLVPAMGSHGGATAEGQVELLATFGVTEERMGAPIRSSMEVCEIGRTERDVPVYLDRNAAEADGILVINRIKAHTDFSGPMESGLMKMITIGLGKRAQAESVHAYGSWGLRHLIPEVARAKIRLAPILLGLALLEDGYDQTCAIIGLPPDRIEAEEPALLERAKEYAPRLPFDDIDLLIVDRIGKEISGCGMDTNVVGRKRIPGEPEFERPRVERLIALDLTEETHGNAIGIGLADFITQRLHEKIDWHTTNTNAIVSGFLSRSMVPVVCPTDQAAVDTALFTLRRKPVPEVRVMRIADTLHLEHLQLSEAYLPEAHALPHLELRGDPQPMRFDTHGRLL
jgi:Lactate racemase N-terminal domain